MAISHSRLQPEVKTIDPTLFIPCITMELKSGLINNGFGEKNRLYAAIEKDEVVFNETKGKWSVRFKQYLRDENGVMRLGKPISILTGPYNQDGTKEIETVFAERIFNNPKPSELIKYLFSLTMMI